MLEINCCVRGYHRLCTATVVENLTFTREPTNESDKYAVASHCKRRKYWTRSALKMSHVCSLFLQRGSNITCLITGARVDLDGY